MADTADITTGNLTIESLQDTHTSENNSKGINVGIGAGTDSIGKPQSGSGGVNFAKGDAEGAITGEQTALLIADGANSQVTAEHTFLKGGMIANASWELPEGADENAAPVLVDHGQLNFTTGTLTVEDLRDYSRSSQTGAGLQVSAATTTISATDEGHRMEGKTQATIGGGNVTVGGVALDEHEDFAGLNRNIDKGQVVTLDQQTGAMNASVTLDNRVIGFNGGWNSIKRDHVTSGLFINEIAQSASDVAKTKLGVTDFFEQIGKYATERVTLEQRARDAKQQARLRGDEGADGSEEGLQELSDALTEAHGLSDGADVYLYDGSQIDDDTPVTGASDFNKALAAGGYHGSESDIYINIDHTDMTNSADTVRVLAHEQARHQMAQQGSTLSADDRSYLASNRGDLAGSAWAAYAGLEGFSTQGSYTSTDWNNQYRFTPKVIAGTNRLAPVPSQQVEPLVPVVVLAGVIAWEGAVIHDELKYGKSFPEAALDTENLLFGVGVGGTVASGGTIGPLATGLLLTGGTAGDVAYQNLVEQTPLSEIDYFNSLNSGLLTATVGGPATRLITSAGAVGSTARWTLLPGMTGYGAYESTGHVLQGYETDNWGQVVYGGTGLVTLGAGLGVAKWGEEINLWPQGGGLPYEVPNNKPNTLVEHVDSPNPLTGEGYGVNNPPVRIEGEWSRQDYFNALNGRTPKGLGKPDLHHADQMPGSGIHEVIPSEHRGNKALHGQPNQGVTPEMRKADKELHWWYRAREQGADELFPDWIYD